MTIWSNVGYGTILVIVVCATQALLIGGVTSGAEKRLFQNITSGYNYISRPVANSSSQVRLKFGISLNQILDLNEKHQILTTYVWIYEKWQDQNIKWNPADFDGLDTLMFPAIHLWVPDIYIFNVAGSSLDGFVNVTGSYVVVSYDGLVKWSIPLLIKSACSVDVTYFPYDKQQCKIQFGSWIYDMEQLDITLDDIGLDLSQYVTNNEFDLLQTNFSRVVVRGSCCPGIGDHPMVIFELKLKRKTLYYDYIVVAPTINLCVLTLATFLLPCECGWKIAIGLTVFLTLYVLQLLIAENVPDTNSTPLIGVFLLLVMTLNCVSLIMATIVMNIKKKAKHDPLPKMSPLLLYVCENFLSKILCTHLSDWKKMAFSNEQDLLTTDSTILEQEEESADSEPEPITHSSCDGYQPLGRTVTAESSFSYTSANDNFIREISYTDRLLSPSTSGDNNRKTSSTNGSYVADEDGGLYLPEGHAANDADLGRTQGEDLQTTSKDGVENTDHLSTELDSSSWTQRKRNSYRKAIRDNNRLSTKTKRRNLAVKRCSIFTGAHMKYQWYFVADVIDKAAFLVYSIVMFVGVITVLVIVPTFA